MSEERPTEQDAPTAPPSLGDVAAWLQGSAQPPPDAVAAGEGEGEGGINADDHGPATDPPAPVAEETDPVEERQAEELQAEPEAADGQGVAAALFELDLAKLAERARASALGEAAPAPPRSFEASPEPDPEPDPVAAPDILEPVPPGDPILAPDPVPAPSPVPDLFPAPEASPPDPASAPSPEPEPAPAPADPPADDEPGRAVAPESTAVVSDDATRAFDLSRDEESDDEPETSGVAATTGRAQAEVEGPVRAPAPRARRQPRYPRGQLREPIGILRRIRAMLGILVVTVLLGIAAGTAVGAFIFFLAFALRNAITSQ